MMSLNKVSRTVDSGTTPLRIFLSDVDKFASQNNSNRLFRLMGTIVDMLQPDSSQCEEYSSSNDSLFAFVIDDGSGTAAVFTRRRRMDSCSSTKTDATCPRSGPQHATQQYHNFTSSSTGTSNLVLSSLPALKVGQTVDCIGTFHVERGDMHRDDQNGEEGHQSSHQAIWLSASAVSIVTSPQEVSLRQIELSSLSNTQNLPPTEKNMTTRKKSIDDNMPKNRILIAGELNLKLNSLVHSNIHHQQHQQQLVFKPDDAFRYIRYSKDDGGISASDLALLVGATKTKEKMAVKTAVEHLQNLGMVYMKQGKYYPL